MALPPDPCLIGIVLVIKSCTGANTVFHYPPRPGEDDPPLDARKTKSNHVYDTDLPTTSSDESDGHSSSTDTLRRKKAPTRNPRRVHNAKEEEVAGKPDVDEEGSSSPDKEGASEDEDKQRLAGNGQLFGSMGLTQLLAPARTFHKKKFEMTLDGLVYLGWPVFVREDGLWRKKKKAREQRGLGDGEEEKGGGRAQGVADGEGKVMAEGGDDEGGLTSRVGAGAVTEERAWEDGHGAVPDPEAAVKASDLHAGEGHGGSSTESKRETPSTTPKPGMTMFNVVFLLNPPPLEYHQRVTEMYDHVVKKFSRALKWEQARSGYVWEQSQLILKLTRKAHENKNPPSTYYPQILTASPLAKALSTLYTSISTSRIAHLTLTPYLPLALQIPHPQPPPPHPALPPLHLPTPPLTPHQTLLLLRPPPKILSSLPPNSPLLPTLTHLLPHLDPHKSLLQLSHTPSLSLPLPTLLLLATHLLSSRHALATAPLHQRNTYIVSPTAPFARLPAAAADYATRFPAALPSLPRLLAQLSRGEPRPWKRWVPSRDHKEAYAEVLAWLVARGWVVPLWEVAWVRVPAGVVAQQQQRNAEWRSAAPQEAEAEAPEHPNPALVFSAPRSISAFPAPSASSSTSNLAALPPPSSAPLPYLLLHPLRASALQSQHLALLAAHIARALGPDSRAAWDRCVKYLDGQHAVERVAGREGWKRGRVEAWVEAWRDEGVVMGGRWW